MRERFLRLSLVVALSTLAGSMFAQSPANTSEEAVARQAFTDSQTAWRRAQFADSLSSIGRIQKDFAATAVAAEAYLEAGRSLTALGYPATAMQELQQIMSRPWPKLVEADVTAAHELALARIALLQRIYLRPGSPFSGPARPFGEKNLSNVMALKVTARNAVYWAAERGVGPSAWAALPPAKELRGLTLDASGNPIVIDGGQLIGGPPGVLKVTKPGNKPEPLEKISAAVQLWSTREWIVLDEDKGLLRFRNEGTYAGPFQAATQNPAKVRKLAINDFDEIAAIDADSPRVLLFNGAGAQVGDIPDSRCDLKEPRDLTFDAFGHLYLVDQRTLAILSPYTPAAGEAAATRPLAAVANGPKPASSPNRGDAFQLRVRFSEPEKSRDGFHNATAIAVERSGAVYVYDKDLKQILVYR
jgi:hypothetical protein